MDFERLFAMPQALDHRQLAAGYGAASRALASLDELEDALAWGLQQPMALLELRTDRRADAETRRQLRRRMAQLSARP
jgi:2-succinyl-5-enolpyruvyl-6-hydroxy-3-cyclohexene-1-carboxylate synthase